MRGVLQCVEFYNAWSSTMRGVLQCVEFYRLATVATLQFKSVAPLVLNTFK